MSEIFLFSQGIGILIKWNSRLLKGVSCLVVLGVRVIYRVPTLRFGPPLTDPIRYHRRNSPNNLWDVKIFFNFVR